MSEQPIDPAESDGGDALAQDPDSYGGLSVEDDEGGTVDPADLAGTADAGDQPVTYAPQHHEADDPPS